MIKIVFIQLYSLVNRGTIVCYVQYFGCFAYHVWTGLRSNSDIKTAQACSFEDAYNILCLLS